MEVQDVCIMDLNGMFLCSQVIYVARNPKDVLVSYFHFHNYAVILETPKDFSVFFERFMQGKGKGKASQHF